MVYKFLWRIIVYETKITKITFTTTILTLIIGTTGCIGPKDSVTVQDNNTETEQSSIPENDVDNDIQNSEQNFDNEFMSENEDSINTEIADNDNTDAFSSIYADADNRMFKINGQAYILGQSTIQDLIDNGIELKGINGLDKTIKPNNATGIFSITLNSDANYTCYVNAANFTDENKIATECLITLISINYDSNIAFAENTLEFAFPFDITEEELRANSGEPTNFMEFISEETGILNRTIKYEWECTNSKMNSGYYFDFKDGVLSLITITYDP